jgi:23S rRNA-/tRNA-specific pseudouridylate synthase
MSEDGKVRISKLMSEQGLCSRREADAYIERGWVFVDGERVTELGSRAYPTQKITLSKEAKANQLAQATILLNKPVGYVSGQAEQGYKPAATLVTAASRHAGDKSPLRFNPAHLKGLAPAGRLDIDSTGLLVLTQDGRIAKLLIGDDSRIEKEYLVRVEGTLDAEGTQAAQPRPLARRPGPEAGESELAERGPAALRAARRQEAPDPPHVRTGRPEGDGPQAHPDRQRETRRPAAGQVALPARG